MLIKALKALRVLATRRLVFEFDKIEFEYRDLPWKKIRNWFLAELSYSLGSRKSWSYPTHVQVEPTSSCNLSCPMCYISTRQYKKGHLSLENFKQFIDEVQDYILFLHFWGWGEPFVNPDAIPMIKYAEDRNIKVITSTNGHLLKETNLVEKLIDSGLHALIFALDGPDRESYECFRHKGDFDKALGNLRLLVEKKAALKSPTPVINLRMVVTQKTEGRIDEMMALARELNVDILSLKSMAKHGGEKEWERLLPVNPEYRRYKYDEQNKPIRKKNRCRRLWNHASICQDGTVTACCYHLPMDSPLGNVFDPEGGGFTRIWFGETLQKARTTFLEFLKSGKSGGLLCETCDVNYTKSSDYVTHALHLSPEAP